MNIKVFWGWLPTICWGFKSRLAVPPPPRPYVSQIPSVSDKKSHLDLCTNVYNKTKEMVRLSRLDKNIISVSLLSVISGWVTRPHAWSVWISSPPFLAATLMLHLMTSASMILNDIQDYPVDCINNPHRPLVIGTISKTEANIVTILLFSVYTYLGIQFLPPVLDPIWGTAITAVSLYTPILKRICFIKNVACATIIASSVPFVGWSVINPLEPALPDFHWLWLTTRIVFTTSLFIEMILDITDKEGDRSLGIRTVPVIFGEPTTLGILGSILGSSQWVSMTQSRDVLETGIIVTTYLPLYFYIYTIYRHKYDKRTIKNVVNQTTCLLGLYLIMTMLYQQ